MNETTVGGNATGRAFEIAAAVSAAALTIVLGLVLPGLGLVVGVGIALVAYRHDRRKRNALIALGVVVTAVSVLLAVTSATHGGIVQPSKTPPVVVHP